MKPINILNQMFAGMPPVAAMQVHALEFDGERLRLTAPLAANVNDKRCAFGGSLASLMTLAGWGLLVLKLRAAHLTADVYVANSQIRYLAPLYDDLHGQAQLAEGEDWETVLRCFRDRGRARVKLDAVVLNAQGETLASLRGRFAILAPSP